MDNFLNCFTSCVPKTLDIESSGCSQAVIFIVGYLPKEEVETYLCKHQDYFDLWKNKCISAIILVRDCKNII